MDEAGVKPKPTLEELARERFPDLSEAELKLLRALPNGSVAHCGDPSKGLKEPVNNPKHADTWSNEHDIRGYLIRWLCVEPDAQSRIDLRGIMVHSARIICKLDLTSVIVRFPLIFQSCKFAEPLTLNLAELHLLDLSMSATGAVFANAIRVRGSVFLREGFSAGGPVSLIGASIGSDLDCKKGSFRIRNVPWHRGLTISGAKIDVALNVEGAKIGGAVFLREGFSAEGEVRLAGASIGSHLDCNEGSFRNVHDIALNVEGAKIGGGVLLGEGFTAEGEVRLFGASIRSHLDCEKGSFRNAHDIALPIFLARTDVALNVEGAKIGGGVLLREGFSAEGEVRLFDASIGSDLDCKKRELQESKRRARCRKREDRGKRLSQRGLQRRRRSAPVRC
jgi:hypothetical protein